MPKFSYSERMQGEACYFAYAMDGTVNTRLNRKNVYLVRCDSAEDAFIEKERLKQSVGSTGEKMNTVGTISKKVYEYTVKNFLRKTGMVACSVRSVEAN